MSDAEKIWKSDVTWGRPSWPLGTSHSSSYSHSTAKIFYSNFKDISGEQKDILAGKRNEHCISLKEKNAIKTLDLSLPFKKNQLKARYKSLVKKHHPDRNNGDKKTLERFKNLLYKYEPQYHANFAEDFKNASLVNKNNSLILLHNLLL